ncbi:MAG: guanylate kinase [Gammaproteobacteria bacterium]|nr:guanylate kinase [Gammaproteobacteria bacterium]
MHTCNFFWETCVVEQCRGSLFIVAAPSGGGKTSLVKKLTDNLDNILVSVSHTTRDKRSGEVHGEHYFFIEEDEFLDMAKAGDFIEHARVFEHLYGTSKVEIEKNLARGQDIVLDIDWQGAAQIKTLFPEAMTVFILPPSLDVLKRRLKARRRDNAAVIEERMQRACDELSHYNEFDYLIVNDNFNHAAAELRAIVVANRLTATRQIQKQDKLLSFLLSSQ